MLNYSDLMSLFEKYGAAFKVDDKGVLYQSPETEPYSHIWDEDWIEVTAPQVAGDKAAHEFLNDINKVFGTDYKLEQFAGR